MRRAGRSCVLFLSDAVTLSQVVRSCALAAALPREGYEVHLAFGGGSRLGTALAAEAGAHSWHLWGVGAAVVHGRARLGRPLYRQRELERYVDEELRLIDRVRPDLVVSDLRWSACVSAHLAAVPLASLVNAYWSPYAERQRLPVPDNPLLCVFGERRLEQWFLRSASRLLRGFASPVDALRRRHGLKSLGDLRSVMTAGELVLYPDTPGLVPTHDAPPHHRYLGPVLWSPGLPLPEQWILRGDHRPAVYVTLGSSGHGPALAAVLEALSPLPVTVLLSTAGQPIPARLPANVQAVPLAPGTEAARRAALVVCSGGASTAYQALAVGTPVLALPSNLDQYLSAEGLVHSGAALACRASTATARDVKRAAERLLGEPSFREAAERVQREISAWDAPARFLEVVSAVGGATAAEWGRESRR